MQNSSSVALLHKHLQLLLPHATDIYSRSATLLKESSWNGSVGEKLRGASHNGIMSKGTLTSELTAQSCPGFIAADLVIYCRKSSCSDKKACRHRVLWSCQRKPKTTSFSGLPRLHWNRCSGSEGLSWAVQEKKWGRFKSGGENGEGSRVGDRFLGSATHTRSPFSFPGGTPPPKLFLDLHPA